MKKKPLLRDYARSVYAQWGEYGILEKIFDLIGTESKVCIEFGAADGLFCSSTANLWKKGDWKAILIECAAHYAAPLLANTEEKNCICINKSVGVNQNDSLEPILFDEGINDSIDLLSIDIDGDDYYIFQSLDKLRPRVIVCEYNPTFPAHLDIYPNPGNCLGCSVGALNRLAQEKGYTLISITSTNCIFVCDEEIDKFEGFDLDLEHMRDDLCITYFVTDYKGNHKLIGHRKSRPSYGLYRETNQVFNGNIRLYEDIIQMKYNPSHDSIE